MPVFPPPVAKVGVPQDMIVGLPQEFRGAVDPPRLELPKADGVAPSATKSIAQSQAPSGTSNMENEHLVAFG